MNTSEIAEKGLHEAVRDGLNRRKGEWPEIAVASDVPYKTVSKIATGETIEPGVLKCQRLWWTMAVLDDAIDALVRALRGPRRVT